MAWFGTIYRKLAAKELNEENKNKNSELKEMVESELSYMESELEDIFFGGAEEIKRDGKTFYKPKPFYENELADLASRAGLSEEEFVKKVKSLKSGNFIKLGPQWFVKTPANEIQEVTAYVYRLEKNLVSTRKLLEKEKEKVEELSQGGFLAYLKLAFSSLFKES